MAHGYKRLTDSAHINLVELNAVAKKVNMAMKWSARDIAIMTDSASVYSWMSAMLKGDKRIRVSGLSKMHVKRRFSILVETLEAYEVRWSVFLVSTLKSKADVLTRVPNHRLRSAKSRAAVAVSQACSKNCKRAEKLPRVPVNRLKADCNRCHAL